MTFTAAKDSVLASIQATAESIYTASDPANLDPPREAIKAVADAAAELVKLLKAGECLGLETEISCSALAEEAERAGMMMTQLQSVLGAIRDQAAKGVQP